MHSCILTYQLKLVDIFLTHLKEKKDSYIQHMKSRLTVERQMLGGHWLIGKRQWYTTCTSYTNIWDS